MEFCYSRYLIFLYQLLILVRGTTVDEALLYDIFHSSSSQCTGTTGATGQSTSFSFNFTSKNNVSQWDVTAQPYEESVFLAELSHMNENSNRSWSIRVGQGGNIYSFIGPYGESVPPQYHTLGEFIDEVWQMVSVDGSQMDFTNNILYYIHQAGIYQKEPMLVDKPFFSPNIAKHCDATQCMFAVWGQHAHVPTNFTSHAIYYTRFKDCGDGVLELTWTIHNAGSTEDGDTWDYFNVPWGGVRASTLRDILHSNSDGSDATLVDPMPGFSDTQYIFNLQDSGGYSIFAEDMPMADNSYDLPCGDGTGAIVTCPENKTLADAMRPQFVVKNSNGAAESVGHTSAWGSYTVRLQFESTVSLGNQGCHGCIIALTNQRGDKIKVNGIIHWMHNGQNMYFWPDVTAAEINAVFLQGDVLTVTLWDDSKAAVDNLAMGYVYGKDTWDAQSAPFKRANTRIRYGSGGSTRRDYTVFTVNPIFYLQPGYTYFNRQYVVNDRYVSMDARASAWVDEVEHGIKGIGDPVGRAITLYSADSSAFWASVAGSNGSSGGNDVSGCGTSRCIGSSTPQAGSAPLYAIQCGNRTYVGNNTYAFAPAPHAIRRPYVCDGLDAIVRPTWTLLGYFEAGSCVYLSSAEYVKDFVCTAEPSVQPTASVAPTDVPPTTSAAPTDVPPTTSAAPTSPTAGPTLYGDESLPPTNCLEWVLGYTEESCSLTCSRVSRVCDSQYWNNILSAQAFDDLVANSHYLHEQFSAGLSAAEVCNKGINFELFAAVPALFTYHLYTPDGVVFQTYCTYPTSLSGLVADCDAKYSLPHPAQQFCPCTNGGDCNPSIAPTELPTSVIVPTVAPTSCFVWVLGLTSANCDETCAHTSVNGTCAEDVLQASAGRTALDEIVANAYVIPTVSYGAFRPNNTAQFCTNGVINLESVPFAPYSTMDWTPMVVGDVDSELGNQFTCLYPSTSITGDCTTSYVTSTSFPAQRFCPCHIEDCVSFANSYLV